MTPPELARQLEGERDRVDAWMRVADRMAGKRARKAHAKLVEAVAAMESAREALLAAKEPE